MAAEIYDNLLDVKILRLLIKRATKADDNGYKWLGMKPKEARKFLGLPNNHAALMQVVTALKSLGKRGMVYHMGKPPATRWFPSSGQVVKDAFGQTELGGFL